MSKQELLLHDPHSIDTRPIFGRDPEPCYVGGKQETRINHIRFTSGNSEPVRLLSRRHKDSLGERHLRRTQNDDSTGAGKLSISNMGLAT